MRKADLVFIPAPGIGHLVSAVEIAKILTDRDDRISITILIMNPPFDSTVNTYTDSLLASSDAGRSIRFVKLPQDDSKSELNFSLFIENQKGQVKETVTELTQSDNWGELAGFVVDMFCTCMIDIANEFGVPAYVFFTSSAASLGLMFHLQTLHDHEPNLNITDSKDSKSNTNLVVPSFTNPVPAKVLPSLMLENDGSGSNPFLRRAKRFRETKGILVNTYVELESHAVQSLFDDATNPKVYPVGPIMNLDGGMGTDTVTGTDTSSYYSDIMTWLDNQPPSSVVFLCFGSMGSFGMEQVKEIAHGLERSGQRFLWSLRQPSSKGPTDYTNLDEVLPEGFLDRTAGIGKMIGWAPQVAVLAHPAIGGFVSHCGWNSTLESLWFGIPIATWPMFAEQQLNAFEMVKELGLGVEIKMDYKRSASHIVVSAGEIEGGIRRVMEYDSEVRKKVKAVKEKSRKTVLDGGSSCNWLGRFIHDVMDNVSFK